MTPPARSAMLLAVRALRHRLLPALVLALWITPSAGALAVGLHVAFEHRYDDHHHDAAHSHDDDHAHDLSTQARDARHDHHHDAEAVPDHDHESIPSGFAPLLRPTPDLIAVLSATADTGASLSSRSALDRPARRAPPRPLFTAHCSLLI